MRILHTADWHMGKRLHQYELAADMDRFIEWLVELVKEQQIDAVLVSGDIFDLANPSAAARQQYYEALVRLQQLQCTLIITGGNHDSPSMLNAPKSLLSALNIHVVGQMPDDPAAVLIPLGAPVQAVVAAVPYLRDADLLQYVKDETYAQREEAVKAGIARMFQQVAEAATQRYPGTPLIGMGHLFTAGASMSDSERDIQVGTLGAFPVDHFPAAFDYLALGHIHRPQEPDKRAWYSGSPIPLSFSEHADPKRVVIYDTTTQEKTSHSIPVFRQLIRIAGSYAHCQAELQQIAVPDTQLPALIELTLEEPRYEPGKRVALEELVDQFEHPRASIIKHRLHFAQTAKDTRHLFEASSVSIAELSPRQVFSERMEEEEVPAEQKQLLQAAFDELLDVVQQNES